jgi:hypothetical protein
VPGADERKRAVVIHLGEPEAAVLLGDLHAERAKLFESFDGVVADLAARLDLHWIDALDQERAQARQEVLSVADRLSVARRLGMDELQPEVSEIHLATEARQLPVTLPTRFRDLC